MHMQMCTSHRLHLHAFPALLSLREVLEEIDAIEYGHSLDDGHNDNVHVPRDLLNGCFGGVDESWRWREGKQVVDA